MSQQPYEPYDPSYAQHDAYKQQAAQPWPGGYEEPRGHTQTFQGQTWDTQVQDPGYATETVSVPAAALPPQEPGHEYQAAPVEHLEHPQHPQHPQQFERTAQPYAPERSAEPGAPEAPSRRLTPAQRARAEGRSPVIEPGMQPALLTGVLGLLLAASADVSAYALLVPLLVLQGLTAAGWFRLNGMWPARQGIALAFAGGVTADVAVLVAGREHAPSAILGTLGVWVLLTLVLQLRSHANADERMYGLMATVTSAALSVVVAGYLAADATAVTIGAAAVAVAAVARAVPLPTVLSVLVALLAAAGAGIAVGGMTGAGTGGALLGFGAGVCALIGLRVASYDYPSRFVHMTAGIALPLAAAAPAVYILGRVIA
ncbi:hypothetical protein [Streptomyces sp. NPDC002851]